MLSLTAFILLSGCSARSAPESDGTFRVAFIADTHVIGPQHTCCSEREGLDNESIMKTEERLVKTRARINAIAHQGRRLLLTNSQAGPLAIRPVRATWAPTARRSGPGSTARFRIYSDEPALAPDGVELGDCSDLE